jgi:uncharacterized membrane protein
MSATEIDPATEPLASGLELVVPGNGVPAGDGVAWIGEGWKLFMKSPVMWIIALVILFIIAIALAFIPIIGQVIYQVLNPVFAAGFVVACRNMERGGEFELEHLFAGFKNNFSGLAILGGLFLLLGVAILLVGSIFFGASILAAFMAGDPEQAMAAVAASSFTLMLGVLVCLALFVPILAAYWFAPALIVMHGLGPVAAMKASFFGSFRNFVPFLLYGLVMSVLGFLAAIPLGLGLLVWFPLMIASTYAAYRAIFTRDREDAPKRPVMVG